MAWLRAVAVRMLRSRLYFPVIFAVILVLAVAMGAQLTSRGLLAGLLSDGQTREGITIVGASSGGDTSSVQVAILGAVALPGVYAVPTGSRVYEVITAAGGALDDADLARVSLAAEVRDGQTLYVPHLGETLPAEVNAKVNINQASVEDLHRLLGVSTEAAQRIVGYRVAHGPFTAVSQLLLVPLSLVTYDRIKDLVTI
ncbi:MAG TPA: ComEA family DNA-binding protein [Ktedonobacterales bacterium]